MLRLAAGASAAAVAAPALAGPMVHRGRFRLFPGSAAEYSARAIELMGRSLVIDMLSPLVISFSKFEKWMANPDSVSDAEFQRYRDSGINVFHVAVGVGAEQGLRFVAAWNSFIANHDRHLLRIDSAADLERVKKSGRIGILIGVQNSDHFRTPGDVELFHGMGQRVSQLTYNTRNLIGNGATERRDDGISDFGVGIIEHMNKVGMAVDVSHCGDKTTLDAFEISKKPVLITHSNCRALVPGHPRCKADEAIRAMARSGGVMGITNVRMFVRDKEPTTIEHMLDHYDHVAKLAGVEHLGVGSDIDLDGYDDLPEAELKQLKSGYKSSYAFRDKTDIEGVDHPQRMFDLTEGLIRRKYTDAQIEGILGGNFKRVLSQIWTV
jgi:membrane dipeptidase